MPFVSTTLLRKSEPMCSYYIHIYVYILRASYSVVLLLKDWNVGFNLGHCVGGTRSNAEEFLFFCNRDMSSKSLGKIIRNLPWCEIATQLRSLRSSWYRILANIMGRIGKVCYHFPITRKTTPNAKTYYTTQSLFFVCFCSHVYFYPIIYLGKIFHIYAINYMHISYIYTYNLCSNWLIATICSFTILGDSMAQWCASTCSHAAWVGCLKDG